jgi:hypothetical protein
MSKVFCIGMFKTGTTSVGVAMKILGYQTTYSFWGLKGFDYWLEDKSTYKKYHSVVKQRANKYQAFADSPWLFLYKELDIWFPNSKFILTLRETPEDVARSDINMWEKLGKPNAPLAEKFVERYNKHNQEVREYFKDRSDLLEVCFEKGEGWKKICNFLEKPVPDFPFPHANRGTYKNE